jgi:hypothetical protein
MYANVQRASGGARILCLDGGARASDAAGFARRAARRHAPVPGESETNRSERGSKQANFTAGTAESIGVPREEDE